VDDLLNLTPVKSEITGTIISIPQGMTEGKTKFYFKVNKIKFGSIEQTFEKEKTLVSINTKNKNDFKIYNSMVLSGNLSAPFKAGNPSQFDYGNYLRNNNAYSVFYAKDYKIIPKSLTFKQKALQEINDYRESIISVHSNYLKSPNLEILGGIVFGDDAVSPPKNIKDSFINSGLLHILAASGMNVAFIYSFFFLMMSLLKTPFKLRVVLGMVMVLIYSLMTGLGASVIRATCMLIFVLIGKLIDRDANSVSLLAFVAMLMLLFNPLYINDVGFQLSFIVTFGIIIMAPNVVKFKNRFFDFIANTIAIPIIAQLWVIPIQIFYFNNISIYSVFANIMSVPILMVLSFGGFVSSLLSIISPISHFVCKIFDFVLNPLITILVNISDFWGTLPHATFQTSHPSIFQILLYYCILISIAALLNSKYREKYKKQLITLILVCLFILLGSQIPIKNSNLEIITFDVGNADCFLIKTPENKYFMIDTAKSSYNKGKSQAEIIVLKYLKDHGIKNLDFIIITHFDNDHCGGATDILKGVTVNKIYVNNLNDKSPSAKSIFKTANSRSSQIILAQDKQNIYNNNGFELTNYIYKNGKTDNEKSIVTLLKYNNFSMLFTGDANLKALTNLKSELPSNITVLKVPHHGAIGGLNTDLVNYFNPQYTILSVGNNKFGHPSIYMLNLIKNSKILRTDINNSILIKVDKNNYRVLTYKNGKYRKL
jgi:competence protein ComEC